MRLTYLLLAASIVMFFTCPGHAQEAKQGFALSMDSQMLTGRPGDMIEGSLTIITEGTRTPTRYELRPMDLGQTESGTTMPVERGLGARSCAGWIRIEEQVQIPPEGSATVPFTLTIPNDARGQYNAYVLVRYKAERPDEAPLAVLVEPTLSVRVEFEVPGRNPIELNVENLFMDQDSEDGRPAVTLEVENSGVVKASLEGDVLLYRGAGTFPIRAQLSPSAFGKPLVMYPGLSRTIRCLLPETPRPGDYHAEVRLLLAGQWRTKSSFDLNIPQPGGQAGSAKALGKSEFDIDVIVKPDFVEVTVPPGATRTVSMRVQNRDTVTVNASAAVVDVVQEASGFLTYADITDSTRRWVKVSPAEWTLPPRSTKSLLLDITAPEMGTDTTAQCAVRILATAGMDETNWLSEADLGVPVIAVSPGAAPSELVISKLELIQPGQDRNPTAVLLAVRNAGGRTAKFGGRLILERASNAQLVQTMNISYAQGLILPPGAEREFRFPLTYLDRDKFRLRAEVSVPGKPGTEKKVAISFVCTQGPG
jgi:hypothetical protein